MPETSKVASNLNRLLTIVREALELSDDLGLDDTSIALNIALVSLDGVGTAPDHDEPEKNVPDTSLSPKSPSPK